MLIKNITKIYIISHICLKFAGGVKLIIERIGQSFQINTYLLEHFFLTLFGWSLKVLRTKTESICNSG